MHKSTSKIKLTVIIALVVAFSGCSHTTNSGKVNPATASHPIASDKYSSEIRELNEVIQKDSKSSAAKNAHM